jgi:hypothetical protein
MGLTVLLVEDERIVAEIYRLTLERLGGLAPHDAVLLDDFEVNLAGARALGLQGVLVGADTDAALAELERILDPGAGGCPPDKGGVSRSQPPAQPDRGRVISSSP